MTREKEERVHNPHDAREGRESVGYTDALPSWHVSTKALSTIQKIIIPIKILYIDKQNINYQKFTII